MVESVTLNAHFAECAEYNYLPLYHMEVIPIEIGYFKNIEIILMILDCT